jgi:hypothetical protein
MGILLKELRCSKGSFSSCVPLAAFPVTILPVSQITGRLVVDHGFLLCTTVKARTPVVPLIRPPPPLPLVMLKNLGYPAGWNHLPLNSSCRCWRRRPPLLGGKNR